MTQAESIQLTLRRSELDDWYVIERAHHANQIGLRPGQHGVIALWSSARITASDIEGTAREMLTIARAIERQDEASFDRCAVQTFPSGCALWSPRNDEHATLVDFASAEGLAKEIRRVLAEVTT